MAGLIPSKSKRSEQGSNAGSLTTRQEFPTQLRRMRDEFDELFDRFAQNLPLASAGMDRGWQWGLDVKDQKDQILIQADAPGFDADDFDVNVSGNRLVLKASHKTENKSEEGEVRQHRECYQSLTLPSGVDKDNIDACYRSGVLTITIPKAKPKNDQDPDQSNSAKQ